MWKSLVAALALVVGAGAAQSAQLENVRSQVFRTTNFQLESGAVLPELEIAYETYGTLAPDGRNAVLLTHGYTSSHHAAGRYGKGGAPVGLDDSEVGWWDKLIGPGKAIDTTKLFVVSSNMLGSSYGSTSPRSINPKTGKPYGPDFPRISLGDIVKCPSFGGYQAFQWAVTFPDFMSGIVAVVTAPSSSTTPAATQKLIDELATDPNWNGGWYYDKGGIGTVMTKMRVATLKRYGIEAQLADKFPDVAAREAEVVKAAQPWARAFDGHSLVVLRRATETFNTRKDFKRIKAKLLYVISRTDALFPPKIVPGVMSELKDAGVDARYFEIDSELGHLASGKDADKWSSALARFMGEVGG